MASYYYLLLSFLFLFSVIFLFLKSKSTKPNSYNLPPGPWTLPVIGSIHHLLCPGLPHHILRQLSRRYSEHLMFLQLGEHPTVVVSSREAVREITKTHDLKFCTRPVNATARVVSYDMKDVVFAPYSEYWREIRKICVLELFSSKRVQSFKFIREEEIQSLIQRISSSSSQGEVVELNNELLVLTNNVVFRAVVGDKCGNQELVLNNITKVFEYHTSFSLSNLFPSSRLAHLVSRAVHRMNECHQSLNRLLDDIIREHREREAQTANSNEDVDDLLTVLLRLHDEATSGNGSFCIDSVKAVIVDLITAGTDTSAVSLEWAMAELMKNPAVMKKVQTEIRQQLQGCQKVTESDVGKLHLMHLIIKESLRLHPPGPFIMRECRETCQILGYDIPQGTSMLVNVWAIGRDSKYWKDAEEFKPERFTEYDREVNFNGSDFELIPFGAGRRICPGITFALSTIELALANLLYHFDWELPHGTKPDDLNMTELFGFTARRKSPLLLHAQPYHIHA